MTVQDSSALLSLELDDLLAEPWSRWRELVGSGAELSEHHLRALDYALRHGTIRLLVQRESADELAKAGRELRRLVPPARREDLEPWATRWMVFGDLLESRREALRLQDPSAVLRLKHAEALALLVVREPGITQKQLGERLELKPQNLSRILGALEANGVVNRRAVGREKEVRPGPNAHVLEVPEAVVEPVVEADSGASGPSSAQETPDPSPQMPRHGAWLRAA